MNYFNVALGVAVGIVGIYVIFRLILESKSRKFRMVHVAGFVLFLLLIVVDVLVFIWPFGSHTAPRVYEYVVDTINLALLIVFCWLAARKSTQ